MNRKQAVRTTMLECASQPFEWGVLDCCLFAARVAERIEGVDYAAGFSHHDENSAAQYIATAGGLEQLITTTLDRDPVEINQLQCGDPVLLNLPTVGDVLGVYNGSDAIVKTPNHAIIISSSRILKGWQLYA